MPWPTREAFRSGKNYALACASEMMRPVLSAAVSGIGTPLPPASWRKGLLLGANHIGDILYRSSSLEPLARAFPNCEWHMLAPEPAAQVLETNPSIKKVHRLELPLDAAALRTLGDERFDVAICYDTGMYLGPLRTAIRLGIPTRIGYTHKGFSAWVTHPVEIRYPQPFPAYFRDLVGMLTGTAPDWSLRPVVTLTEADRQEAAFFAKACGLDFSKPLLACFPYSRQPGNSDIPEKLLKLLAALESRLLDFETLLLGAPSELQFLNAAQKNEGLRAIVPTNAPALRPLVALLERCRAVVCADSGPRHLANAAGVPVFFPRNPATDPIETGIYLESERDLAGAADPVGEIVSGIRTA